jgi:Fe-S cluster assembly iron-binding protein IscA
MVQLTESAAKHLVRLRDERDRGTDSPRFVLRRSRLRLTFAPTPEPGDAVVEHGELSVYVASDVVSSLDQAVIDARKKDGKSFLILRRSM